LERNQLIEDYETPTEKVLFPTNSVISVVLDMSDGDTAEIGIIGRDGMTGLAIVLGEPSVNQRSIVQIPDGALSLPAAYFRSAIDDDPEFRAFTLRYARAVLSATARLSACNALHPTTERCARWLLMAQDRVEGDLLLLTQEFLGQMLGVRRASVALAASQLQEAGFISYSRGHINIKSRGGLESAACECYLAMERDWKSTMGYGLRDAADSPASLDGAALR